MEMQQMMELLLEMKADRKADQEEADANQEKAEADRKLDKEERKAHRAQMQEFMKTLQAYQAKTDVVLPGIQVTETSHRESTAVIKPVTEEVETMACQGMEARLIEEGKPASLDKKPEAAEEYKAPAENATVIPVRERKKKRRWDQKLAAQHRRQKLNTSTRDNCGPQKRLAVTRRGTTRRTKVARKAPVDRKMSRRATVARQMSDIFRPNTTQRNFGCRRKELAVETCQRRLYKQPYEEYQPLRNARMSVEKPAVGTVAPRSRTSKCWGDHEERRRRPKLKCSKGMKSRDVEEPLHQRKGKNPTKSIAGLSGRRQLRLEKKEPNTTYRKTTRLEIKKQIVGSHISLRQDKELTLWRGRPPPKRKKGHGPYGRNRW
jgi:hypothetical protein